MSGKESPPHGGLFLRYYSTALIKLSLTKAFSEMPSDCAIAAIFA